jgi:hypothetical protein
MASTRVVAVPGAIPIQIDSMARLLGKRLDRQHDGGALREHDDRLRDNFSATAVRFFFALLFSPPARTCRGRHFAAVASPIAPLRCPAACGTLGVMARISAVHMPVVAEPAQVKQPPALIFDALDLPQIVHSPERPLGTRPRR